MNEGLIYKSFLYFMMSRRTENTQSHPRSERTVAVLLNDPKENNYKRSTTDQLSVLNTHTSTFEFCNHTLYHLPRQGF